MTFSLFGRPVWLDETKACVRGSEAPICHLADRLVRADGLQQVISASHGFLGDSQFIIWQPDLFVIMDDKHPPPADIPRVKSRRRFSAELSGWRNLPDSSIVVNDSCLPRSTGLEIAHPTLV